MKCGDILLAIYPFTDQSGTKVRPVLTVWTDDSGRSPDLIVLPISSQPDPGDRHAFFLPDSERWFSQTGLKKASSVKWTKPMTISPAVIHRWLGELPPRPLNEILSKVQGLFEPTRS